MKNNLAAFATAIAFVVIIAGIFFLNQTSRPVASKVSVVGSFYPLAHFAQQVGGDAVSVSTTTPAGSEPHDYEPTPQDIVMIRSSRLFVFNGNGLDSWAEKIRNDVSGVTVLRVADSMDSLPGSDPHFWLDPVLVQKEIALIRDGLIAVDSVHADLYQKNASDYTKKLQQLDHDYQTGLAHCSLTDIVTSHAAFGYLAKRYHVTQVPIAGLSPDEEPSPKRLAEVADLVKAAHIRYIFFETLVSPKLAETIASETGAKPIVFNPLEGLTNQEIKNGKTYLSVMQENLANLRQALNCS